LAVRPVADGLVASRTTAASGTDVAVDRAQENQMHILWMLIIGLVVGALAKLIMPGKDPGGAIITILLGVAGALLAGMLGRSLGWYETGEGAGFIASILGAVVLLAGYRLIVGRRHVAA
jgi:uncharacterized membrane protein YeaQ/YmgE (transglycosylase-associated protein family)